jgi:homoserine O-succinyltransferase
MRAARPIRSGRVTARIRKLCMPVSIELRPSVASTGTPRVANHPDALVIGLVNNMPDSVLETTEVQFCALLEAASSTHHVIVRYSALAGVPRGAAARAEIATRYWSLAELIDSSPDALIVTGTEPRTPRLQDEPYWAELVELLDWAELHAASSLWSCLAAHAAVLHLDGIERRRLSEKRSGVFAHAVSPHALTAGLRAPNYTPHSRWNDLPPSALQAAGYTLLSHSLESGADVFVKEARSLLVFLQGHPEYDVRALLKEYQRDVARFLAGQQQHYPSVPVDYFSADALRLLEDFRAAAFANRDTSTLASFPYQALAASLVNAWRDQSLRFYRNWLVLVAERRAARTESRCEPVSSRR